MTIKLDDAKIKDLPLPATGNKIHYDTEIKGFGCRVTASGAKSFILNYRTRAGRERRFTIGDCADWTTGSVKRKEGARWEAVQLKQRIDRGEDPLNQIEEARAAKTVADMCKRFEEDHISKKRDSTAIDYKSQIKNHILPALKNTKVADVSYSDIDALHRKITKAGSPYAANRVHSLLSKMFNEAIKWKWRTDNPCIGIERNQEEKRHRYLSPAEIAALTDALAKHDDQQAANIIRLLVLTGARRGEALAAKWEQFDLTEGVWVKPASTTKQKKLHRVPLNAPARQLLSDLNKAADDSDDEKSEYVFPAASKAGHRVEIKYDWASICKVAKLADARIHDLRHTFASVLASSGLSLPIIGALLGHSQPATTARYSHLMDDPLRQATERVGAVVMPQKTAEIISIGKTNG